MKKIFLTSFFLLSTSLFAFDLSFDSGKSQDSKIGNSESRSKSMNNSLSRDNSEDESSSKEKSLTLSEDLSKIQQVDSFVAIMALEKAGIEPFVSCKVLSRPKLRDDFGLGCKVRGMYNSGKCSTLDTAAKTNAYIVDILDEEISIKKYMSCVALYGGVVAQHMKTDYFSPQLKDSELKERFESFSERLETDECRFSGSVETILCGASELKISANPNVSFGDIVLYSNQNFYGYTSSIGKNKSNRKSKTNSMSESRKKSLSTSMAKSINQNKDLSDSLNKSSKANLSLSKFLPGG